MSSEINDKNNSNDNSEKDNDVSIKKNTKEKTKKKKVAINEADDEEYNEDEETANESEKAEKNRARKKKREEKDEDDKENEKNDEDLDEEGDVDETDGRRKKRYVLNEEEEPLNDDVEAAADREIKKPANSLAAKKSVAQGMMDIALITANANQLRYMVEYNQHSSTFYINVILISVSLILQLLIGIALIYKTWLYMQGKSKQPKAKMLNIYVTAGVFAITIINVFIASFTVTGPAPVAKDKD